MPSVNRLCLISIAILFNILNMTSKQIFPDFGFRLQMARKKSKMTQEQVASALSIHVTTYGKWELGKREPGIFELTRLCRILHVALTELIPDADQSMLEAERAGKYPEEDEFYISGAECPYMFRKVLDIIYGWDENSLRDLLGWCSGYDQALKRRGE